MLVFAQEILPLKNRKGPRRVTQEDAAIGQRLRTHRLALGMSQQFLSDALGVSFQQVQKYEKGTNRLSGSRLSKAAQVLKLDLAALLASPTGAPGTDTEFIARFTALKEGVELARCFERISPRERTGLLGLARAMADSTSGARSAVKSKSERSTKRRV